MRCGKVCVKLIHCGNRNLANVKDNEEKNIFFMPMGLLAIGNVLKNEDFDTEIIHSDLLENGNMEEITDWSTIDMVGFDCHWVNQSLSVLETADQIKKINPKIFIFLGGYTASFFSEEILRNYPQIDAIIRGDGEVPVAALCDKIRNGLLQNGRDTKFDFLQAIPNLTWRNGRNEVILNELSYIGTEEQMNKLEFVELELLRNWEYYRLACRFWTRFEPINATPLFFLEVGRGCQHACTFCGGNCDAQKRINNRKGITVRSTDAVMHTIKKAIHYGFTTFYASFEFEGSDEWYIELLKKGKEENLNINFVFGSWKLPSKRLIDTLSEYCNHVIFEISPETADEQLRYKNKDRRISYSNHELEQCLDYISTKNNIKVQLYFGYFLAFDSVEAIDKTFEYIVKLATQYHKIVELEYFNFSTDPASLLYLYPEKFDVEIKVNSLQDYLKYIKENYVLKKGQAADLRVFKPKSMSEREVETTERKIQLFNLLFTTYRNTISYVLLKTERYSIVLEILKACELNSNLQNCLSGEEVKELLMNILNRHNILNINVISMINEELNKSKNKQKSNKVTPRIWINDCAEEDIVIGTEKEAIEIEFDF